MCFVLTRRRASIPRDREKKEKGTRFADSWGCLGYIDLSKRRVSPEDVVKCEERYNKSKAVHSIMRHVAEATLTPLETLYQEIGWPLDRKYGHSHDAFKLSIT